MDPAAAAAAVVQQQAAAAAAAGPAPFALNPAAAAGNGVLDYSNKLHKAHYIHTTKSLYNDKETKFDLTEERLQDFLTALKERTDACEVSPIDVPVDLADPINGEHLNYIDSHGQFTKEHLRAYVVTYLGQHNRGAQDDYMLYQLLVSSLSHEAFGELSCNEDEYVHETAAGVRHKSGILLLAYVLTESAADAAVDPDTIRKELSHATIKFKELKHNVDEFNAWISLKVKQLRRHGQSSTDLRTHLMSAYRTSEDKEFVLYINALKDDIRDNRRTLSPKDIMSKAKKKSEDLEKERKFDGLGQDKDEHILALETRLEQLEQAGKQRSSSGATPRKPNKKKAFPNELKDAPRPEDPTKPKIINGTKYWYCLTHNKWGVHPQKPQDGHEGCRKYAAEQANLPAAAPATASDRAQRAVRAFQALVESEEDSE